MGRLGAEGVRELEVRRDGIRVRVVGAASAGPPDRAAARPAPAEPPGVALVAPAHRPPAATRTVNAPLTGIFYRSPSPQAPPLVQVGSVIAAGDVIGLIEAMKLFNEIRSTAAGRVARLLAENGQLVRAHQPLLELE